jgi:CRP-like cAMP-binding protein
MSESKPVFVDMPIGSFVFREGDAGSDMYIIESGTLEVVRSARGDVPLATLGPGDFFGEMAILEDQPRFASVRAVSAARLLRVDRAAFAGMLRENFEIAVRIMRKLVARLRRTEELLQSAQAELDVVRRGGVVAAAESPVTAPQLFRAEPAKLAATRRAVPIDPEKIGQPMKLVHVDSGSEFALSASKPEMLIGRPDPVTGLLPEINLGPLDSQRSLSRRHAKIVNEGGLMFLREEVGTTNGTFINGERVATGEARPLSLGDTLRFGSVELRVESL